VAEDDVPFNVENETLVGDLTEVKELRQIMPVCQNLKVRIAQAGSQETKDKDIRSLKLQMRVVDGLEVTNPTTGETSLQFINKPLFTGMMDLVYWADLGVKGRMEKNWWRNRQHLVGLKKFLVALGMDLTNFKVNDALFEALLGREILVDIKHEEDTSVDPQTGEKVKLGTYRERIANWKKA
jgi:hypothetical protein